jgi:hypothetical protein
MGVIRQLGLLNELSVIPEDSRTLFYLDGG